MRVKNELRYLAYWFGGVCLIGVGFLLRVVVNSLLG